MQTWRKKKNQIATVRMIFLHSTRSGTQQAHCAHDRLKKEDAVIDLLHKPCVIRLQVRSLWWAFKLDWWRSIQQPQSPNIKHRCWRMSVSHRLAQTARLGDSSILNKFITWSSWERMFFHLDQREALNVMCFWNCDWWCVKSSCCLSHWRLRIRCSQWSSLDCCVFFTLAKLN